jgi:hypothetical protein
MTPCPAHHPEEHAEIARMARDVILLGRDRGTDPRLFFQPPAATMMRHKASVMCW